MPFRIEVNVALLCSETFSLSSQRSISCNSIWLLELGVCFNLPRNYSVIADITDHQGSVLGVRTVITFHLSFPAAQPSSKGVLKAKMWLSEHVGNGSSALCECKGYAGIDSCAVGCEVLVLVMLGTSHVRSQQTCTCLPHHNSTI